MPYGHRVMSGNPEPPARVSDAEPESFEECTNEVDSLRERLRLVQFELEQCEGALWQLSQLFHRVGLPIVIADTEGCITDLNAEAEERWGKPRSERIGGRLHDLVPADRHAILDEMLTRCRTGERVNDVERRLWDRPRDVRSTWMALSPMRDQHGAVTGVVLAEDPRELKATGRLLETVNEELRSLALVDGLTQLANRRRFERAYEREFGRAARQREWLSLMMIDVDYFKDFNDALGHAAGDACLSAVAQSLAIIARRPGDLVARYGGEEFVVILPSTDARGALGIAERARAAVLANRTRHPASKVSEFVTVSIGVASARVHPALSADRLRTAADACLYDAKREGRNRVRSVMVASEPKDSREAADDAESRGADGPHSA